MILMLQQVELLLEFIKMMSMQNHLVVKMDFIIIHLVHVNV